MSYTYYKSSTGLHALPVVTPGKMRRPRAPLKHECEEGESRDLPSVSATVVQAARGARYHVDSWHKPVG